MYHLNPLKKFRCKGGYTMSLSLFQGILLSLWAFITGAEKQTEAFFFFRPIVVATGAGIILGDPVNGAIVGGLTELAFAGLTPAGGSVPPDPVIAGLMGAVFACAGNVSPTAALGLALPFCILMQYIVVVINTAYAFWMKPLDKMIDKCDVKSLVRLQWVGIAIVGAIYMVFTFLATFVMQDAIQALINIIPIWLMNGLEVAGGVMPALGFGMLLVVMFKVNYLPFLIVGFLAATYLPFDNLLPVALIGIALAMYNYFFSGKEKINTPQPNGGEADVGI